MTGARSDEEGRRSDEERRRRSSVPVHSLDALLLTPSPRPSPCLRRTGFALPEGLARGVQHTRQVARCEHVLVARAGCHLVASQPLPCLLDKVCVLEGGVALERLLEPLHRAFEDGPQVAREVPHDFVKVGGAHKEEHAVGDRLRGGCAPLACEHRELAEECAGHQRREDDSAVEVFDLYAAVFDEEHAVARLVHPKEPIAAQQHLWLKRAHERLDEHVVCLTKHGNLAQHRLVHEV
eukprot:scaffold118899_cov63-Phaeocystis_antarctica.AAC.3